MDWLSSHWQEILSVIGVLIATFSGLLYIRTILAGESKPHRVTWGGWTLVGVLGLLSSVKGGAGIGIIVAASFVLGVTAIFCLSLFPKYGKPGGTKVEWIAGIIAAAALLLHPFLHYSPTVGTTIAIGADLVFLWPTLKAAWFQPETEALQPWVIGAVAETLGVVALGTFTYAAAGYSVYILVGNLAIIAALMIQKPKQMAKMGKKRSG